MSTNAARPSDEILNKVNVNPSVNRSQEATAEDFNEIGLILEDHADLIDTLNARYKTTATFYGFFDSVGALEAAHPDGNENDYAFIVDGSGVPTGIVIYQSGAWTLQDPTDTILYYDNLVDFPGTGLSGKFYVATVPKTIYLWYNGQYNQVGKDGNNGLSAYEVAVSQGYSGTMDEWLDSLKGAVTNLPMSFHHVLIDHDAIGTTRKKVADAIAAWDNTELPLGTTLCFFTHRFVSVNANGISVTGGDEFAVQMEFFILKKALTPSGGVISVGTGGETVLETDLLSTFPTDTRNISYTEHDLGDIGSDDIHTAVNEGGPYTAPKPEAIVFRAEQDGTEKLWLYVGSGISLGTSATTTALVDFVAFPTESTEADPDDQILMIKVGGPNDTGVESPLKITFGTGFTITQDVDGSAIVNFKDPVDIEEDENYATLASMILDQGNQTKGMILFVENASSHPDITAGYAFFQYLGTTNGDYSDYRIISSEEGNDLNPTPSSEANPEEAAETAPSQTISTAVAQLPLDNHEVTYLSQVTANTADTSFTPVNEVLGGKCTIFIDTTGDADFPAVNSVWKITVSGTGGTATLSIGVNDYVMTFDTDIATTLSNFITAEQANILADTGLSATASGSILSLVGVTGDAVSIANTTGDLNGVRNQTLCRMLTGSDFEEGEFDLFAECVKTDAASPKTNLVNYFWIKR